MFPRTPLPVSKFSASALPSLLARALLVLLAAPAVLIGATAALTVSILSLPLLLLGQRGGRPALRWHRRHTVTGSSAPGWPLPAETARRAA